MHHRTRGIVIALASAAVGGLLPAAISAYLIGMPLTAAGLGAVVLMNAVIAFIHISVPARSERAHESERGGIQNIRVVSAADPAKPAQQGMSMRSEVGHSKFEPFPVIGWYAPQAG
jgi:hypothetical protein